MKSRFLIAAICLFAAVFSSVGISASTREMAVIDILLPETKPPRSLSSSYVLASINTETGVFTCTFIRPLENINIQITHPVLGVVADVNMDYNVSPVMEIAVPIENGNYDVRITGTGYEGVATFNLENPQP